MGTHCSLKRDEATACSPVGILSPLCALLEKAPSFQLRGSHGEEGICLACEELWVSHAPGYMQPEVGWQVRRQSGCGAGWLSKEKG